MLSQETGRSIYGSASNGNCDPVRKCTRSYFACLATLRDGGYFMARKSDTSVTMNITSPAFLPLKPRATKRELLRAMDGHTLAEAQTSDTYQRKIK
jgi:hypothetical protein